MSKTTNKDNTETMTTKLKKIIKSIKAAVDIETLRSELVVIIRNFMKMYSDVIMTVQIHHDVLRTHQDLIQDLQDVQNQILKRLSEQRSDATSLPTIKADSTKLN